MAFLPLSQICLLPDIFLLLQTKYLQTGKWPFAMQRIGNVCRLFCVKIVLSFTQEDNYPRPLLSEPICFFLIKVLSYSVLSMHHFSEYLNSSVSAT